MKQLRVGWDFDGVAIIFDESFHKVMRALNHPATKHPEFGKPAQVWDFFKTYDVQGSEFVEICHKGADMGLLFDEPVLPGVLQAMLTVKGMGHLNIGVTDRPFGTDNGMASQRITRAWAKREGLPLDEIHFTAQKDTVALDLMIDDKLENYDMLDAAGVEVYLLNRPWNRVENDTRRRVDSVTQYARIVAAKGRKPSLIAH